VGELVGDRLVAKHAGRMDHGPDFYAAITLAEGDRVLMWLGVQLLDDEQSVDARAGAHLDLEKGIRVGTGAGHG